jgi:hypothetical protein
MYLSVGLDDENPAGHDRSSIGRCRRRWSMRASTTGTELGNRIKVDACLQSQSGQPQNALHGLTND